MTDTADTRGESVAWSDSDGELAEVVWGNLTETARSLFSVLMNSPGTRYSGDELGRLLALPEGKKSVAGALSKPSTYCKAVGRELLWEWEYPKGETACYWVTADIADLFEHVRAN